MKRIACCFALAGLLTAPVHADVVQVTITGVVEFNGINAPPLSNVNGGDPVTVSFLLDSNSFIDSMSFPTRGYLVDEASFSATMGAVNIGFPNPLPPGDVPLFVLRDNDPAVDGFFLSSNVDFPIGVPLDQPAIIDPFFRLTYSVTYGGMTLNSLNILDAVGTYDFTGLSVFNFAVLDGPFKPMLILFEQMTIETVSECFLVVGDEPGVTAWPSPLGHTFFPQVSNVLEYHPVLMDDLAEFVIPLNARPNLSPRPLDWNDPSAPVSFTVQVLMWNPEVFPQMPEQFTNGLRAFVMPDGHIYTRHYGDSQHMDIWVNARRNETGDLVVTFPFSIDGI